MSRRSGWMLAVASALACGTLSGAANAAPVISIGGLAGAEHWVWHEGEDAFTTPNGSAGTDVFRNNNGISGWIETAPGVGPDNVYERTTGNSNVRAVEWTIHMPAAMSSATRLFARASINRADVGMTVTVDTTPVADRLLTSGQVNPTEFLEHKFEGASVGQGVPVGALAAGGHAVRYQAETAGVQGFSSFMVDGILFYDGTPILPTVSTDTRRWLRNPTSVDSPALPDAVTPVLNVTGLVTGNDVRYFLNGAAYTPGTEIGAGDHELVVAVYADDTATSKRLAFAGANFTIVPEPASLLLVAGGVVAMLSRRESRQA